MAEECTHNCSTCSANCSSKDKQSLHEQPHALSSVKHIIAVVSGKGGVGKSLVTSMLAVNMQRLGYKCAILDADVTGPSIPKAFGLKATVEGDGTGIDFDRNNNLVSVAGDGVIELLDASGRVLKKVNGNNISIADLETGIYIVRYNNNTVKVVKK